MVKPSVFLLLLLALLFSATAGTADVIDPYDNGAAPPGTFALVSYFGHSHFPEVTDDNGTEYDFGLDASSAVIRPVYFIGKIDDRYSYGINGIIPIVHLSLDGDNAIGAPSSSEVGLGDIGLSPFIYLYESQESQIFISFWEFIFLPTGKYNENDAVNIGRDGWWFQHQLALAWYPSQFGIDFNVNYFQFTESDKLDFDDSDALELETVVHYILNEKFIFGINGAYWIGLSDAEVGGESIPNSKPMNIKLGANLTYLVNDTLSIGLRWMHDIDSENYPEGDSAYIKLSMVF
ncbi:transporter [Desulforhopalus singaporensis]|uniref:Uncharacterized conserved protein n=1 Tax=Desulforhopalus singaporensis TaxID=91360 RepID=A0A1H0SLF7_9BACT|nr:transporter [Desulforhopalus singaporensis]SDP42379.1 Uncharacterized conserved protein [Desulforhopalus singaporensis]